MSNQMRANSKNYTGREGRRGSFAADIDYKEYIDDDGSVKWEGYGRSDDRRIEDFHETRDSIPEKYRTDTIGLDLPTGPELHTVTYLSSMSAAPGSMYNDYTKVTYFDAKGDVTSWLREARYAIEHDHVESRGCYCQMNPCDCPDEVWDNLDSYIGFIRVANGWLQVYPSPLNYDKESA